MDWSEEYNKLPIKVRHVTQKVIVQARINQLEAEKDRLKRRYQQSMSEINEQLKYLWIDLEKDYAQENLFASSGVKVE